MVIICGYCDMNVYGFGNISLWVSDQVVPFILSGDVNSGPYSWNLGRNFFPSGEAFFSL